MTIFPSLDKFPVYKKLRASQNNYVFDQDFIPVLVDDIFTDKELKDILQTIREFPLEKIRIQKWGGQGVLDHIKISDSIIAKIQKLASEACHEELIVAEYSIVKYSPEYGYEVKLFPHYDTRQLQMFVFDVQLQTNEDWGIIIEGKQFNLLDNQALLFSGTQQMHWRENKKLKDDSEILMMFFWLKHKISKPVDETQSLIMLERQRVLQKETNILSDETLRKRV
jgi:hypothetical protein